MEELFHTLPKILEFTDDKAVRESIVFAAWRKVAGDLWGKTLPTKLEGKCLSVAVSDEKWKQHLERLSQEIIFKINSLLKQSAVNFIEFYVDESLSEVEKKTNRRESEDLLDEVSVEIRSSADQIKDDNLRYQFLLAVAACLERKKALERKT